MQGKRDARARLSAGPIPLYLRGLQWWLQERGGEYFADNRPTVADLKVLVWLRQLRPGILDHVLTDLPERHGAKLVEHFTRVLSLPRVEAYYASR